MKKIAIIVTLDTKGDEASYLRALIEKRGHEALIIDIGCRGEPSLSADITRTEVAEAAGADVDILRTMGERERRTQSMIAGAVAKLGALCATGDIEGMVSIGGMSSAVMASSIYREMPYLVPKLLVTSAASLPTSYRFFGPTGVTVMHSMVEVGGLNYPVKRLLARAAAAICGMAEAEPLEGERMGDRPIVAMTTNGLVEHTAQHIVKALEPEYEVVRYHATGVPEVAMERFIEEGKVKAVIDLVPSSITNEKFGGTRISWPRRLEVAGETGVPQVVATCLVNAISRARDLSEELAAELEKRMHYVLDEFRVIVWLNAGEVKDVVPLYAEKLNKAVGPTKLLIPMKGWAEIETAETGYLDSASIRVFADDIKTLLKPEISVEEVDANIDSVAFADAVVRSFREVVAQVDKRSGDSV